MLGQPGSAHPPGPPAVAPAPVSHWQLAMRRPRPALRPFVIDMCGYAERTARPLSRREFPVPHVVVILEFGPPLRIIDKCNDWRPTHHAGGFVAGLGENFTVTEHDGLQRGLQLNLTPIGARRFFGLPMAELAGQVVSIDDVLPAGARDLTARLQQLPSWQARFDLLEEVLIACIAATPPVSLAPIAWAVERIAASGGTLDIAALTRQLGYSPKHVISLFREHVGIPPKLLARIVRFDHLVGHVKRGGAGSWAQLAQDFGYFNQSHLVRDVRQFTGTTPTQLRGLLVNIDELASR